MPLYRCVVAPGLTSLAERSRIARDVTRIHCEVTDALPQFVHTFFSEDEASELPAGTRAFVLGTIRAGRTAEQKTRLQDEMAAAIAETLGVARGEVSVITVDLPARWVMEGGDVLPEPGDEAAWLARHGHGPTPAR
jgi:phenylpyruvate tautomerase PptA (4-oxalocrotonate tautomerase family)